jgi:serine/threonine protein kinase
LIAVLFSEKDKCWKIADFGTASRATSKRLNTTRYSRGTAGYRSPEILHMQDAKYNNKADIFALGCIVYEIVTGQKLFYDDVAILNYSQNGSLGPTILWPSYGGRTTDELRSLERLVASMLELDPLRRPSARQVQGSLCQRWLTEQTNRTEHFRGPVRFVRVRRHTEQNRTVSLFGSCSADFRTCSVRVLQVRTMPSQLPKSRANRDGIE